VIEVKRKEGESVSSFLYRFTKKIQRSGVLKEAKKKRFKQRERNKRAKKDSAVYRYHKKAEISKLMKLGRTR